MSDKKFNLKNYEKISGDEPIGSRLMKQHEEAPNVTNEKQLEDYRGTEANTTIEKLLEKSRTGEETEVTEKRLDTHKSKFANKYRNEEAYTGDINKLEEKRLKGDATEKEKYEAASEAPKQFRWWEEKKGPDGLKLAKDEVKKIVVAAPRQYEELNLDRPNYGQIPDLSDDAAFDVVEDPRSGNVDVDDEFDIIEDPQTGITSVDTSDISEVSFEERDIEGTPMAVGRVAINIPVTPANLDIVKEDVVNFLNEKHPHLNITVSSLPENVEDYRNGQVEYVVSPNVEVMDEVMAATDFDIVVESAVSKKK